MSLKAFHLVFIALSVVLAIGFAVWEVIEYANTGSIGRLIAALLSFIVAAGLIVYGVRFVRKLKHIGYL